jgi:hypothetical protein
MTAPTKAQLERAQQIAAKVSKSHGDGRSLDFQLAYTAALAAIIETQEDCARIADWGHMVPPDGGSPTDEERKVAEGIAAAIRDGSYREDNP